MFTVLIATILAGMPDCLPDCLPDIVVVSQPAPLIDVVLPIPDEAPPLPIPADKPKQVLIVKPQESNCPGGNCSRPQPAYQPRGLLFRRWR